MIHIYEKVCKTRRNEYGIEEMDYENPFKKGPCIITLLAMINYLKELNDTMREVANIVNPDIDKNINLDRRIFGLSFGEYKKKDNSFSNTTPKKEDIDDFIEVYFYPLFTKNNCKIDLIEAMKNVRYLTFVTYFNGSKVFKMIEESIREKMIIVGYSEDEMRMIFSQICVATINDDYLKNDETNAFVMTFGDINNNQLEDLLLQKLSSFINTSLENALENKNSNILIPITYEKIQKSFEQL